MIMEAKEQYEKKSGRYHPVDEIYCKQGSNWGREPPKGGIGRQRKHFAPLIPLFHVNFSIVYFYLRVTNCFEFIKRQLLHE